MARKRAHKQRAKARGIDMFILYEAIRTSWALHEDSEPDISTERLTAMVMDDTGADYCTVLEAVMEEDNHAD